MKLRRKTEDLKKNPGVEQCLAQGDPKNRMNKF